MHVVTGQFEDALKARADKRIRALVSRTDGGKFPSWAMQLAMRHVR